MPNEKLFMTYQLKFQSKWRHRALDAIHIDRSNACDGPCQRLHAKRCQSSVQDDRSCKQKQKNVFNAASDGHMASINYYTIWFINAGVVLRIIGINVSTIHWLSQSHFHGFSLKSIVCISSQRPSNWNGKTEMLLLCKRSCLDGGKNINCCSKMLYRIEFRRN